MVVSSGIFLHLAETADDLKLINADTMLLQRVSKGETDAFRDLFDKYKDLLYTFCYGLLHSKTDAEEVVQEVFLKIWKNREALDHVENLSFYIYRMARNRSLDMLAMKGRQVKLVKELWANMKTSEEPTEQILAAKESQALIHAAISQLSPRKQQIISLSRDKGLSHDEIAKALGISKQTVKNNLSEALKQVKEYLDERSALLAIAFWVSHFALLL